ncbi:alpha/beta hydrolase family protein [Gimesia algae]|uniref:Esterase n=1 Tax=Gimesia algae TaxID=2527971 RepID=A0A517VHS8_9PLAN|nr:alpha/beta fold hydrolase [Gimesia algae]QDT92569.1 esterase [Gimesia algae]
MNQIFVNHSWCRIVTTLSILIGISSSQLFSAETETSPPEKITRHQYSDPQTGKSTSYLLYHPDTMSNNKPASLLIYLHGAGGSLKSYNYSRQPYQKLRSKLSQREFYVVVPELGKLHFMNEAAKQALDGVTAQVLSEQKISKDRVHIMGTSMGGGSALAYTLHRPDLIRSVCAVMPMTDFADWIKENPRYAKPVTAAYGGSPQQVPDAYQANSAIQNVDTFQKIPVMLIHGLKDRTVLPGHSQKLANRLHNKQYHCELVILDDLAHSDEVMRSVQIKAADFFENAMK